MLIELIQFAHLQEGLVLSFGCALLILKEGQLVLQAL
jgi:hypothetical protein